jgi:hypothetical protein
VDIDQDRIKQLVNAPGESLAVELKQWINLAEPEGQAKVVKTVLALRNFGGGYMVIGFHDKTLKPDTANTPEDVQVAFHIDAIQALISKFASESFEIALEFPERDGQRYPVIVVPSGVRTPVAAKSILHGHPKLVEMDAVYIRSLNASNVPCTTKATWKDWPRMMEIFFDNREADIGRFFRRHLAGITPEVLKSIFDSLTIATTPEITIEEKLKERLLFGRERLQVVIAERKLELPSYGTWEIALTISGQVPPVNLDTNFLSLLDSSNPDYTGWPIWLISRGVSVQEDRPYVFEGAWEAMIVALGMGHVDFMRLDPAGNFYLMRALQDDLAQSERAPKPFTGLDFCLPIIRVAEALAVGIAFAQVMGSVDATLSFAFKWSELKGRELMSWTTPDRYITRGRIAHQAEVTTFVNLAVDTPLSALAGYVQQAVAPLLQIFDGFELGTPIYEDLTKRLIERRL